MLNIILSGLQERIDGCTLVDIDGQQYIGLTAEGAHDAVWNVSDGGIQSGGAAALVERLGFGSLSKRPDARAYFTQEQADRLWSQVSGF